MDLRWCRDNGIPVLRRITGGTGVVHHRDLSVSLALHFARKGRIRSVAALLEDSVEVFEVEAVEGSRLVSLPLSDLGLARGILMAAVQRDGRIFIPGGDDHIEPGDQVIVAAATALAWPDPAAVFQRARFVTGPYQPSVTSRSSSSAAEIPP